METLRHTRNHLLQRHHHRECGTFQQRSVGHHTRFECGQRQCQQDQTEEEGDGFPALCESFHRFCTHRHKDPCAGHTPNCPPSAWTRHPGPLRSQSIKQVSSQHVDQTLSPCP